MGLRHGSLSQAGPVPSCVGCSVADLMPDGQGVPTGTPLSDPALVEMVSEDPVLRDTKLIAEAWDCDGLNQVGAFPHYGGRWSEWNGHFRDTARMFVKVGGPASDTVQSHGGRPPCLSELPTLTLPGLQHAPPRLPVTGTW